jgi:hypothetical protein
MADQAQASQIKEAGIRCHFDIPESSILPIATAVGCASSEPKRADKSRRDIWIYLNLRTNRVHTGSDASQFVQPQIIGCTKSFCKELAFDEVVNNLLLM